MDRSSKFLLSWKVAVVSMAFALLGSIPSGAQDFRAKLTVTVTDPTGSAVSAADLELTNTATGESHPPGAETTAYILSCFSSRAPTA